MQQKTHSDQARSLIKVSIASMEAKMDETMICAHCQRVVPYRQVPAVDDDAAWKKIAAEHEPHCGWVTTRAHRATAPIIAETAGTTEPETPKTKGLPEDPQPKKTKRKK